MRYRIPVGGIAVGICKFRIWLVFPAFSLVSGCMGNIVQDIDPKSAIAQGVQSEYRRFITSAEGELGSRQIKDGKVVPTAAGSQSSADNPKSPPRVESLLVGRKASGFYWDKQMGSHLTKEGTPVQMSIDDLLSRMLAKSNQLAASSDTPLVRNTGVTQQESKFDPYFFAKGSADTEDNPRTSLLETGASSTAPTTLDENHYGADFGIGMPLVTGGKLTVSQHVGHSYSNSEFFIPSNQADSRWQLELRQPLLDGAGVTVATAPIQLARLDRSRSIADFQRQITDQFMDVIRTYWTLYAERAHVLQRRRLVGDLRSISDRIAKRSGLDTLPSEAAQAASATRTAEASVIRAQSAVQNSEARLAALASDLSLFGGRVEIIPTQPPIRRFVDVPLEDVALLALQNRPEIRSVALQVRGAELQTVVAKNKLLPDLDVYAGVSNSGLGGNDAFSDALSDQFDRGHVDASVGVELRIPFGNRNDKAVYQRSRIELRQATSQLKNVSDTVLLEAQVSVRELRTAYEEMRARQTELASLNNEVSALQARADEGLESGSAFLATIITGLENREKAEEALMEATVTYNLALYTLEHVAGTMLSIRGIEAKRIASDDLDYIKVVRAPKSQAGSTQANTDILTNPKAIERPAAKESDNRNGRTSAK